MNEREALACAEVLRTHVAEVVTSRLRDKVLRDAFCACGWELPWDLTEREEALTHHRAEVLAALVAQARSDALAPVLALADAIQRQADDLAPRDDWGKTIGDTITADNLRSVVRTIRAAASSHPTGNQP